jgi:hypothetical protein
MSEDPKLIFSEPTPGQFITELHCWIATYPDGTEGIIAYGIDQIGTTPLISSHRDIAEKLEPLARHAQSISLTQATRAISIRLVTFTSTDGVRQ